MLITSIKTHIARTLYVRLISFLWQSFTSHNLLFMTLLFVAHICPILEHASQVSSLNIELINHVEIVQWRFTKHIKTISRWSYSEWLNFLRLPQFETRHFYSDLLFLAKLRHNHSHLHWTIFVCSSIPHSCRFISSKALFHGLYHCFISRIILLWNALQNYIISADNSMQFCYLFFNADISNFIQGLI